MRLTLTLCLLVFLFSCHNDSENTSLPVANPVSATYTDATTGEKFAEEHFEYTPNGEITVDAYEALSNITLSRISLYEYDADGNLVKQKSRSVIVNWPYHITEYAYADGLKKTIKYYDEGSDNIEVTELLYNHGNFPDSSVTIGRDGLGGSYTDVRIFTYDNSNHLILETMKYDGSFVGKKEYTYEGDNLVKSCVPACTTNEYNRDGLLVKTTLQFGSINRIMEERFYMGKRLDEKWIYIYDLNNLTARYNNITKIKYQY
jgi:hypothetical protein